MSLYVSPVDKSRVFVHVFDPRGLHLRIIIIMMMVSCCSPVIGRRAPASTGRCSRAIGRGEVCRSPRNSERRLAAVFFSPHPISLGFPVQFSASPALLLPIVSFSGLRSPRYVVKIVIYNVIPGPSPIPPHFRSFWIPFFYRRMEYSFVPTDEGKLDVWSRIGVQARPCVPTFRAPRIRPCACAFRSFLRVYSQFNGNTM